MSGPTPTIETRPARAEDREPVLAFCVHTWPDGDYIPDVWDEWLASTDGVMLVATAGGRAVGLVHLRMMSPEEGWIEGIRVDPAARRLGIGRMLLSRALVAARERGATVARLLTGHENLPSQRLIANFGFTRVAEVVRYDASAFADAPDPLASVVDTAASAPGAPRAPAPASVEQDGDDVMPGGAGITIPGDQQFERIWDWLVQSNLAPLTGGLEFDNWAARALTEPSLRAALAAGHVLLLEEWDTILALAVVQDSPWSAGEPPSLEARYVDGLSDGIGRLAFVLREIAQERGLSGVTLWLPDLLILHDAMDGAGYTSEDGALWVYARSL